MGASRKDQLPEACEIVPNPACIGAPAPPGFEDDDSESDETDQAETLPKAKFIPRVKYPTEKIHFRYIFPNEHPNGVADEAAYWAEIQLFGELIVFDRGTSGEDVRISAPS